MSWVRRLLLLAGLVFGSWLLGSAAEANADVRIEIDLPIAEITVELRTSPPAPAEPPVEPPPPSQPRTETPPPPPVVTPPPAVEAHRPAVTRPPAVPAQAPVSVPAPVEPQPRADLPMPGFPPQSGAGQTQTSNTSPVGLLPANSPGASTGSVLAHQAYQDLRPPVRAEDPTFSPD